MISQKWHQISILLNLLEVMAFFRIFDEIQTSVGIILLADDVDDDGYAQKWHQNSILLNLLKVMAFFRILDEILYLKILVSVELF